MSNMMSQEEIDAMMAGKAAQPEPSTGSIEEQSLSQDEMDILGEIGNICMGTSATTMYTLLGRRCTITTPRVTVYDNANAILKEYTRPFVIAQVGYTAGLEGTNLLLLKDEDAAVITNLLLGGDGNVEEPIEMGEMEISAMAEVMNQMVGSSATAMADLLGTLVDIAPPKCEMMKSSNDPLDEYFKDDDGPVIRINFKMEIEDVLDSEIMQAMPLAFGKELVHKLMVIQGMIPGEEPAQAEPQPAAQAPQPTQPEAQAVSQQAPSQPAPQPQQAAPVQQQPMQQPLQQQPMQQQPMQQPMMQQQQPMMQQPTQPLQNVEVKPVQYASFDTPAANSSLMGNVENIGLLMDVPLQVTVELGQTKKSIQEILEFGTGSVIVLEKLAGELVEVMANGKLIARGEVVVIDENYGVRITDILSPAQRMNIV